MNAYGIIPGFLGTFVEFLEVLTVVLAVGMTRGWRSALAGVGAAMAILIGLATAIGAPLVGMMQVSWVELLVGLAMLLIGTRWLRKAILRYAGLQARHDQAAAFQAEVDRQQKVDSSSMGLDSAAFMTTFGATFLEGLEACMIVITVGLTSKAIGSAVLGAVLGALLVLALGLILRKPLTRVPDNAMKFVVGVMLTTYGTYWFGGSLHVAWPHGTLSVVYLCATLSLFSWFIVSRCRRQLHNAMHSNREVIK